MKSTANINGHPLHPMIIPFPIAFFIGALLFDIIAVTQSDETFWIIGKYLAIAGIISALMAAVPGIVDYFFTVPPKSSAKKRATKHGLVNVSSVILFSLALLLRPDEIEEVAKVIGLEALGVVLLGFGGWMGGTLVYRNQIGVDHRYANAGKWKEERLDQSQKDPILVGSSSELKVDQMKLIHLDGRRIVIGRTEQGFVAFDDHCTHRGGSLADGVMICGTVHCPWHGSQFEVSSGAAKAGPAKESIATYKLEESEGKLFLTLSNLSL
ncbi:MAG TPA: DUF2231 domain-containing protein [Cytophagales bacterium]|nr:DUF2231 domain-containing protein [Cytophagales bacterium]